MTKIKLSALACAILVGGGQQLVAEDLNDMIDLGNSVGQSVKIDNETKNITGYRPWDVSINVDNNGELISGVSSFFGKTYINIKNDSKATFENELYNEVYIEYPNFHINDSTAVFNDMLYIWGGASLWPVIEKDNDFSGGGLSLDNSTLDIKGSTQFDTIDVLINHGSTATINNLYGGESKIYVVNDSKLEINQNAKFYNGAHLIVKDNSNTTIKGALTVENGTIELDNGSAINIKGDFENHGVIYYGASADSAPKITVDGKATLKDTTEIGIYATSGDISNLNQLVFLESKGAIENEATDENIYAMYFDPDNKDANEEGLVKYDQNIIDAVLNLSKDGKKLLAQISMSDDMKNKLINEKIDFITKSTQTAGVNLTAQDLDIITSLFTIEDAKGNGAIATEVIKLAAQATQGNQEAAQTISKTISKTAQSIQKNSHKTL